MNEFKLRKWQKGDEQSLVENANNYKIWKNLKDVFPHPYTLADAFGWVNFVVSDPCNFAIEVEGKAVGGIGILFKEDIYRKNAEIGYWLGEKYWGNDIVSEAVKQVTAYAFEKFDIKRLYAGVFEYNTASMKVLEKAGYQKEAILRQSLIKEGKFYDEHIFSKIRE